MQKNVVCLHYVIFSKKTEIINYFSFRETDFFSTVHDYFRKLFFFCISFRSDLNRTLLSLILKRARCDSPQEPLIRTLVPRRLNSSWPCGLRISFFSIHFFTLITQSRRSVNRERRFESGKTATGMWDNNRLFSFSLYSCTVMERIRFIVFSNAVDLQRKRDSSTLAVVVLFIF